MRLKLFVFLALSGWILLPGCHPRNPADLPRRRLVVGLESSPLSLDPRFATDANSVRIGALVFNSLVRADQHARFQPELAERWEALDERSYLFHLKRNAHFQDGKPLTAKDVRFTYESLLAPQSQSPKKSAFRMIEAVESPGPYQLLLRFAEPYAPFLETATLGIVPAGSPPPTPAPKARLIGSGPFVLEEFIPGERIVLSANHSYWQGPAPVSDVVFQILPDAIVRVMELKKGSIDLLQNDIEPDMIPWLQKNSRVRIQTLQGSTFQYVGMNLDHPILKNLKVRQALAYAIDREAIIRHLLKDLALPATGVLSPSHWAYEPSVRQFPYDPEKAKRLLDEAGFPDPDGAGPLPRFKLSYKTTTLELRRRIAEAIREELNQIGVELEVRAYEWGAFYDDIKKGNFHLYSLAWVGITDPDVLSAIFHSRSVPPNGDNRGRYQNPRIDRLLEQGRRVARVDERRRIYSAVQKILAEELPYIPLWWVKNVAVMNPAIDGFTLYPDGGLISLKDVSFRNNPQSP